MIEFKLKAKNYNRGQLSRPVWSRQLGEATKSKPTGLLTDRRQMHMLLTSNETNPNIFGLIGQSNRPYVLRQHFRLRSLVSLY